MKKLFAILMALMVLGFTQCKPAPEGNDGDDTRKVKVRCEIPMNNTRSDFTNLLANGKVNWSHGRECVYLAVHGEKPQIIEMVSHAIGNPAVLTFEGEVATGLIQENVTYDVWYFGHSNQAAYPNYEVKDNVRLEGSIAKQSGRLGTFGYNHIAKTSVIPTLTNNDEGDVILSLVGKFEHQIAVLLMDLKNVNELYGDAIIGTDYVLAYNGDSGKFELDVTEDEYAKIEVEKAEGISYIAVFPNAEENTEIRYAENQTVYECIVYDKIKASNLYYSTASDGVTKQALPWSVISSGDVVHGDGKDKHYHHYVDLGLPSGTLWATKNLGADTLYAYGDYFSWGETETKEAYTKSNYIYHSNDNGGYQYNQFGDIAGTEYDAATAIWGSEWRMPTYAQMEELYKNCTFEPMKTSHGTNGYKVTSKKNANYIFLPAAGYRDGEYGDHQSGNYIGHYWTSTPPEWIGEAPTLHFEKYYTMCNWYSEFYLGCSIRPVLAKTRYELEQDQNQNENENGSDQGGEE